MSRKYLLLIMD